MPFLHEATPPSNIYCKLFLHSFYKKIKNCTLRTDSLKCRHIELLETHTFNSVFHSERACLYTSNISQGSITLEAAVALPLFMLAMLSIIYIMNIIYLQTSIQIAMEETARDISKTAYITSEFYAHTTDDDYSIIENIGARAITIPYIKDIFLEGDMRNLLNQSYVAGGADGISFDFTSIDMENSTIDIVASYTISIPFLPDNLISLKLSNHCYMRIYMGKDMKKEQQEAFIYVYYTVNGSVLHTNKYCQYLLNYSEALRYNSAAKLYSPDICLLCSSNITIEDLREENPVVYLTSNHEVFHLNLDCQAFTKDVFRQKRTSLENEDICQQCLKGK